MPAFARRYQGVLDPLNNSGELEKLIKAATGDWDREVILTDETFVGLRAMDESWANRFFGRKAEVRELVEKLKKPAGNFYIDTGTLNDTEREARLVKEVLIGRKAHLKYIELPEGHNWSNWRARLATIHEHFFPLR